MQQKLLSRLRLPVEALEPAPNPSSIGVFEPKTPQKEIEATTAYQRAKTGDDAMKERQKLQ